MRKITIEAVKNEISKMNPRSAWKRGVKDYAEDLIETVADGIRCGCYNEDDITSPKLLEKMLLNGASDWKQYSWGGCALIYDEDIAKALCCPSELKITRNGQRKPNAREEWLDTQARALFQASMLIRETVEKIKAAA